MRDPALHIRQSDLSKIFPEMGLDVKIIPLLLVKAQKFSIKNRIFVTTRSASKKKSDRSVGANTDLLNDFNRIYMGVMLSSNIKTLPITKTSPQHLTLVEVCWQAAEFCKLFNLGTEEGMQIYIEIGIKILGRKFGIYRFKGIASRVVEYYQAKAVIDEDSTPEETDKMINAWAEAVKKYYNTTITIEENARIHFIHAKNDAKAAGASPQDWIFAQFEKYSYLNSIPAFSQFYSDNALLNYQIYKAKNHKDNKTKEEQDYFTKVKNNEKEIPLKKTIGERQIKEARLHGSI